MEAVGLALVIGTAVGLVVGALEPGEWSAGRCRPGRACGR